MATSANVIEYQIYKDNKRVGYFRKHLLCKYPDYGELLKYQPLEQHKIVYSWCDEEENYNENNPVNLKKFLRDNMLFSKWLNAYFNKTKNLEQILSEIAQEKESLKKLYKCKK
jgi:hypothetical protein